MKTLPLNIKNGYVLSRKRSTLLFTINKVKIYVF